MDSDSLPKNIQLFHMKHNNVSKSLDKHAFREAPSIDVEEKYLVSGQVLSSRYISDSKSTQKNL